MSIFVNIPEKYITLSRPSTFQYEPIISNDIVDWVAEHDADIIFDYDNILNNPMVFLHRFVFVRVADDATAVQFKLTFGI